MIESLNHLREPLWLWLGLVPLLLWLLSLWMHNHRANQYADAKLKNWVRTTRNVEQHHRYRQLILTQLAWVAFAVALAGPRVPEKIHDDSHEYYQEVMLVLDLSLSMSARDSLPSRIERAKLESYDLISRMQNVRLGIVVYAAKPHLLAPFTHDKQALRHYIKPLRTQLLPTEGSQTLEAMLYTANQFSTVKNRPRSIILISDGESNRDVRNYEKELEQLSVLLKEKNISLYTLGIGTQQGAALLSNHSGWLEDNHQAVVSKLNRRSLVALANIGNGVYNDVQDDDSDWLNLYDQGIALKYFTDSEQKINDLILWQEYSSIFIILAVLFLSMALVSFNLFPWKLTYRKLQAILTKSKYTKTKLSQPANTITMLLILGFFITFLGSQPNRAYAIESETLYKLAYQQFQKGDWQQARDNFAKIPGYSARFAEGVATYKLELYKLAATIFIQATLDANTEQQRIDSIFNLANSYFKLALYQHAESLYMDVLRYQPTHRAAQVNLTYARTLFAKQKAEQLPLANRAGSGIQTANAPENMDISNSKVSLGESESPDQPINPQTDITSTTTNISSGLEDSAPASQKIETIKDDNWTYDINDLSILQQQAPRIQSDEAILWQRLFEVEESFEAAQDTPNVLPGVKPW